MNLQTYRILGNIATFAFGGTMIGLGVATAQQDNNTAGVEVLTRGPIHEAFAGTVSFDPKPGILVDRQPPDAIEEVPPEQRLAGDNVVWIPGYWAWDEDQNDFLWISGIWRNLPPGRQWVPGYWAATTGRYQWTSGYWEDAQRTEVSYLPEPPHSVESGPNIAASSNKQTWNPGNWIYRDDRYAWQPGYWVDAREDWSWTPAYYRSTPRGYVYVDGYWDYPVARRGVVFAPVHFEPGYMARPDFYYTPLTVVALSVFADHLFLRPNYGHYYFGDYYEPRYRDQGFCASYSYNAGRQGYDPIYAHYRWENRNDQNWDRQRQDYYEFRRDHAEARPPRTWAALSARSQEDRSRGDFGVADRLDRVVGKRGEGRQQFQTVDKKERAHLVSQSQEIRKYGREREHVETQGARPATAAEITRVKVQRSPVVASKSDRSEKKGGPPPRLQARALDDNSQVPKGEKTGNRPPAGREDSTHPKPTKDGTAGREGEPKTKAKPELTPETRTKPGQKRQVAPTPDQKTKPDTQRQATPTPEHKAKPDTQRQATPTPEHKAKPDTQRQATPSPERQAKPVPKSETPPTPERKAKPVDKKREPAPAPAAQPQNRQAPAQRVEQKPAPKAQPPQASRQPAPAQPQRKEAARPQPQKAQPSAEKPQEAESRKKKKQQSDELSPPQ